MGAITSITFFSSASCAVRLSALRTACSAQSPFRPCVSASARSDLAASLIALRRRSLGISPPPAATGVEEPRFVLGAMAARSAACTIQTPAEAARAPSGETYTSTGVSEASSAW